MSAALDVTMGCAGCPRRDAIPDLGALPDGWDAIFVVGRGWRMFCPDCVAAGGMEAARLSAHEPPRAAWAYPGGMVAMFKPATRSVLLATPDGMAELDESDAAKLRDALIGALAIPALARSMAAP